MHSNERSTPGRNPRQGQAGSNQRVTAPSTEGTHAAQRGRYPGATSGPGDRRYATRAPPGCGILAPAPGRTARAWSTVDKQAIEGVPVAASVARSRARRPGRPIRQTPDQAQTAAACHGARPANSQHRARHQTRRVVSNIAGALDKPGGGRADWTTRAGREKMTQRTLPVPV